MGNGVAACASQAGVCFFSVDLFLNGTVKAAVKEDSVIVTPGTPFAGLGSDGVLHVLDGFSIELIVERREVMDRAFPLLIDLFVAFTASGGVHEEIGRDDAADVGFRGRGEEWRFGSAAFALHSDRRGVRIVNAIVGIR